MTATRLATAPDPPGPPISGFLIVRNAVAQGYPFLEAIQSALPVCDEFLIADGYSEDGTWEALGALRDAFPERVRLFRDRWPREDLKVIADMTNVLRRRCRFDYCLNLQANEVLHEDARAQLRALPALYPAIDMFSLPFLNLMGRALPWFVDFRRRLFRNRPAIVSKGDGYDVGYRAAALWREPRTLRDYALRRTGERTIYLCRPVYRYRGLGPSDYLTKLETRRRQTGGRVVDELRYASELLSRMDPQSSAPDAFWTAMRPFLEDVMWRGVTPDRSQHAPLRCLPTADAGDHPTLMQPLFAAWRYPLAESLARLPPRADR